MRHNKHQPLLPQIEDQMLQDEIAESRRREVEHERAGEDEALQADYAKSITLAIEHDRANNIVKPITNTRSQMRLSFLG